MKKVFCFIFHDDKNIFLILPMKNIYLLLFYILVLLRFQNLTFKNAISQKNLNSWEIWWNVWHQDVGAEHQEVGADAKILVPTWLFVSMFRVVSFLKWFCSFHYFSSSWLFFSSLDQNGELKVLDQNDQLKFFDQIDQFALCD